MGRGKVQDLGMEVSELLILSWWSVDGLEGGVRRWSCDVVAKRTGLGELWHVAIHVGHERASLGVKGPDVRSECVL